VRKTVLASAITLGAALPVLSPAAPANAANVLVCTFHYDSGTGTSDGTALCTTATLGVVQMVFTAVNSCPTQSGQGAMSGGPGVTQFSWTRAGNAGVITTIRGSVGTMAFSSTCPADGEIAVLTLLP
jgi:hypothetical protein